MPKDRYQRKSHKLDRTMNNSLWRNVIQLKFVFPWPRGKQDILEEARKRFLYCAWGTFGEREREREREIQREKDGSDVTIVALKLAMNLHFPFAKNSHNWRWVYTFPCQKLALFVSPFTLPVSPFTERSPLWGWNSKLVHTFRCQKKSRATSDRKPKTNDQILPSPILFFGVPIEKMNQINTKNYWK